MLVHSNAGGSLDWFMGTIFGLGGLIVFMFIFSLVSPKKGGIQWK